MPHLQVVGGTLPPTRAREGWSTCVITGVRAESCIEICKGPLRCPPGPGGAPADHTAGLAPLCNPGGRGPAQRACAQQDVLVHRRFSHFFLMMWFVVKVEHIIRNHTRCWLDEQDPDQPVGALCSLFERQEQLFCKMHGVFEHAYEHVTNSLQRFIVEHRDRFQPSA